MSGMGSTTASILPEDVEEKLKNVQRIITELSDQKISAEKDTEAARNNLAEVNKLLDEANAKLAETTSQQAVLETQMQEREGSIAKKESALEVYSNALLEKENKINKYLKIFDNMKDVIS